jgi:peptide-methionine (S)-S-oxide reductase
MLMLFVTAISMLQCIAQPKNQSQNTAISLTPPKGKAIAAFAEGCFWCAEHVFEAVAGVEEAVSGYAGGNVANPSYEAVGAHLTGHAEAVLVYYDPKKVSYSELVKVFFTSHDPTTLNRQGPDEGTPYRSVAFFQNATEKEIIDKEIQAVNQSKRFKNKVVTEVKPLEKFYKAEEYHQNYVQQHPENPYVQHVSIPRFDLFKQTYKGNFK